MEHVPLPSVPPQFKGQHRLPSFAVPRRYDLTLKPDLTACVFSGSVSIDVDVVDPTKFLVLNALDLAVDSASVSFKSHQEFRAREVVLNEEDEILVLAFESELPIGRGVLGIGFSGVLNDHMRGFYRSKYVVDGIERNMAVTQFEAVEARRCFPCWDEPALKVKPSIKFWRRCQGGTWTYKWLWTLLKKAEPRSPQICYIFVATFKITLEVPSNLIALSNMPATKEVVNGLLKTVHFEESPIMSTYLVAIVVGLFDRIEDSTPDGIKVCVYCPIGKGQQGKFGQYVAIRSLELFKIYFSVPYPLPKLDLVVIPDFSGGAMENYGLITFRDTALLYDESYSSAANKQWITTVVAHEVAHMWFGNLVTMEWWTHLWLNEGFATWVSYLATDEFFPDWKIWTQFLEQTVGGLKLDALSESHPIEVEVLHARGVDQIFDAISYKKGSSVIRMLQTYLGDDVFQKSLASYVKRYAYQNAKTEDLWDVLSEESGMPMKMMMETWTKQKGYPVVSVKFSDCMLEFEQSQFSFAGSVGDAQWIIPLTLSFGSYDVRKSFLLESKIQKLDASEFLCQPESYELNKKSNDEKFWIKANVEQTGFYRVKYDDILSARLRTAIEGNCLSPTDRFGILDDSFALFEACEVTLSSLLSLMDAYREELDYIVLSRLISIILRLSGAASHAVADSLNLLQQYFISIMKLSTERLGWDRLPGESHRNSLLRGELLTALVKLGQDETCEEAIRRFHIFFDDKNSLLLPPDTRKATYTAVMRSVTSTNRRGLEYLFEVYRQTDMAQEKGWILSAMTSCPDPNIVLEALNFLLSSEVRDQDVIYGLAGISWEGGETAWSWLKENWELISERWGHHFLLTHFLRDIITLLCTDEKADEIEDFFQTRTEPSIERTLKQSIEQVRVNARWVSNMRSEHDLEEIIVKLAQRDA